MKRHHQQGHTVSELLSLRVHDLRMHASFQWDWVFNWTKAKGPRTQASSETVPLTGSEFVQVACQATRWEGQGMPPCRQAPALRTRHMPALGRRTSPEPKPCPCPAQMQALRPGKVPGEPRSATSVFDCLVCMQQCLKTGTP